jgi:diguanylate cyclase
LTLISFLASGGHASSTGILIWNTSSRLIIFSLFGLLVRSLRRLLLRERNLARTDPLTGLVNRLGLEDEWETLAQHLKRHPSPLCLAIVDLDRFKMLNDEQGHTEGDQALKEWAELARRRLRTDDTVARVGGDEFVIVLPRAELSLALARLTELKSQAEELFNVRGWPIGLSIGVAAHHSGSPRWSDLMSRADLQLYRAKQSGKGQIQTEN